MQVDSLTLGGTINVAVDVTSGIVSAGSAPVEIELLTAKAVVGTADFELQLEDEQGLLEASELSWSGSVLTLNLR